MNCNQQPLKMIMTQKLNFNEKIKNKNPIFLGESTQKVKLKT